MSQAQSYTVFPFCSKAPAFSMLLCLEKRKIDEIGVSCGLMSLRLCRVVLVKPHYPGNIGAAARIMRNFGLEELVLVEPLAVPDDPQAKQLSTHGQDILDRARIAADLGSALADCVVVAGTSAPKGGLFRRQTVGPPEEIIPHLLEGMAASQPVAIVFGPEPTGLTNDEVTRCHYLIEIPANEAYPSINLAQAVAICLYELHKGWLHRQPTMPNEAHVPAPFAAQEQMFEQLRHALEGIHFLYGDKAESLMHAVRHLLGKARLTPMEVNVLLGLARQINWYVDHHT
jgi:tRNA/rRNA methyltransferase